MLEERNIRKSAMSRVRSLFQSPPAGSGFTKPFTVYDEDQARDIVNGGLLATRPFVCLTDAYVAPREPILPLIVVETERVKQRPFELANRKGRRTTLNVHIFGRSPGERDDLGSFIVNQFGAQLAIVDYSTSGSLPVIEYGVLADEIDLETVPIRRDDLRQEGSLDAWAMATFTLMTKN